VTYRPLIEVSRFVSIISEIPMHLRSFSIVAFAVALAVACDSATSPESALAGRWATEREGLSPAGSYQSFLAFDGAAFTFEVRSYGLLHGQRPNDLSAYSRTEGTFRVEGDRLHFLPSRLVTWDGFYGASSPERVESPYPWGSLFDDARFSIRLTRLTLRYLSYPADAPVETTRTFLRE
jgi:hypothetical protein